MIVKGLDFLMAAGKSGRPEGQNLVFDLDVYAAFVKKFKTARKFLAGMASAGLTVCEADGKAVLGNSRYPAMMLALKTLADRCSQYSDQKTVRFHLARCDFRALEKDYSPDAMDLYRVFSPPDLARVTLLHEFLIRMNYKTTVGFYAVGGWAVNYQGKKQIKATPLFQIELDERDKNALQLHLKCASANRIVALIPKQPRSLQDDFYHQRKYTCRGAECGWCKGRKWLSPAVLVYDGKETTICWYTNPDVKELNDDTVELIKQYAFLHEELLPAT
jgi:hypothetical protein